MKPTKLFIYIGIFYCLCAVLSAWMVADVAMGMAGGYKRTIEIQKQTIRDQQDRIVYQRGIIRIRG